LYFYGDNFVKPFMFKLHYKFWEIVHKYTQKLIISYFYYISATHYCSKSSRVIIGQTHLEK